MFCKRFVCLGAVLPVLLLGTVFAEESLPPANQWIPADAIAVVELSKPAAILDRVLDPKVVELVTSMPAWEQAASQPGFQQFKQIVAFSELRLGTDWKTAVRKAIGGGITAAVFPNEAVLLIVDAEDEKTLTSLHDMILDFAKGDAADRMQSTEYKGVTCWTIGGDEAHAIIANRLVLSNKVETLHAVLDLHAKGGNGGLAASAAYQGAKRAAGEGAVATAFVNLATLKQIPDIRQTLAATPDPGACLLIPGVIEALRNSDCLALGLHVEGNNLALKAIADGKADGALASVAFSRSDDAKKGALPNLSVPRQIAGGSFYRDLHQFYAAKDDLFPQRTSGIIFFENMMGIFFSGRDLTEEVLAELGAEIRFVVAEQEFDPAIGTPGVQFPAAAAVFRMHDPEKFGEVMEEAWQKGLGLINFTRGQQALPGLIIDRPTYGDVKYTVAYFASSQVEDRANLDSRFNLRPTLVTMGDYLILSSTEGIARDLIDALKKESANPTATLPGAQSRIEVDGRQLASILKANRDNLVRQNMIEDGNTKEQAELQADVLATVAKHLGRLTLQLGTKSGRTQAELQLQLNLP